MGVVVGGTVSEKGANTVSTPARELIVARGSSDLPAAPGPSFARGLWRIAAADVSSGNAVMLLHDGPATFSEMIHLIDRATTTDSLIRAARRMIEATPGACVDYLAAVDCDSLAPVQRLQGNTLIALAVYFGTTRLIDNIVVAV